MSNSVRVDEYPVVRFFVVYGPPGAVRDEARQVDHVDLERERENAPVGAKYFRYCEQVVGHVMWDDERVPITTASRWCSVQYPVNANAEILEVTG